MAVTKADKVAELEQLEQAFKGTESAVVVDYKGLKVPEVTELRRQVRGAKGSTRSSRTRWRSARMKGTPFEPLEPSTSSARPPSPTAARIRSRSPRC